MKEPCLSRVVVTGVGCVTALGLNVSESWERIVAGSTGLAMCPNHSMPFGTVSVPSLPKPMTRSAWMLRCAASQASGSADFDASKEEGERGGVLIGVSSGDEVAREELAKPFYCGERKRVPGDTLPRKGRLPRLPTRACLQHKP